MRSSGLKRSVLLLEPKLERRTHALEVCASFNLEVTEADDLGAALNHIAEARPDAILSSWDLAPAPFTGAALLAALQSTPALAEISVIFCADQTDEARRVARRRELIIPIREDCKELLHHALRLTGFRHPTVDSIEPMLFGLVMLADDSAVNRTLGGKMLSRAGAEVDLAEDGEEVLARFEDRPYDLLLLDIEMPGVDGFETVRRLRARGVETPTIAVTGHDIDDSLRQRTEAAGFNTVLTKPIDRTRMIRRCARLLQTQRRARS